MGRSLEEIEYMFTDAKGVRDVVRMSKEPLRGGGLGLEGKEKEGVREEEVA